MGEWPVRVPRHRIGLGAGITDPTLIAIANALYAHLHDAGCTQGVDSMVEDFQNVWNTNNPGSPLVLANGTPGADGLYGANTQAALQTVLNASGQSPPPTAPTGCVAAAAGSANATQGGGSAPLPSTTTTTPAPASNFWLWAVAGGGVAAIIAAYAASRKKRL